MNSSQPKKKILLDVGDGGGRIELLVELADSLVDKAKGLMGRKSLGEFEGMLFVFDKPGYHSFWMFNTHIALEAIHIAEDGTVVDILKMEPCGLNPIGCKPYRPSVASKYVLEVNRDFSKRHKMEIGKSRVLMD